MITSFRRPSIKSSIFYSLLMAQSIEYKFYCFIQDSFFSWDTLKLHLVFHFSKSSVFPIYSSFFQCPGILKGLLERKPQRGQSPAWLRVRSPCGQAASLLSVLYYLFLHCLLTGNGLGDFDYLLLLLLLLLFLEEHLT